MGKFSRLISRILDGKSDANIAFGDLRRLLLVLGFQERTKGSHHIFRKEGVEERINVQQEGNQAKPYLPG